MSSPFLVAALVPIVAAVAFLQQNLPGLVSVVQHLWADPSYYQPHLLTLVELVVQHPASIFWVLFVFRYLRLVVHIVSFWCFYRSTPVPTQPAISTRDCSIVLSTIDPESNEFKACFQLCLHSSAGEIVVVTVGRDRAHRAIKAIDHFRTAFPQTNVQVHFTDIADKRSQIAHGIRWVTGTVTVLVDDYTYWRSMNFLPTILAPFENDKVGAVTTNKRVYRTEAGFNLRSFWNMMGALYHERQNFEMRATNAIDGGVSLIPGLTAAYRTSILQQSDFLTAFTNERFLLGRFGPLLTDGDNFLTRQVVAQGYDIKVQYSSDALTEVTLNSYPKFIHQCVTLARATWRSNFASLFTDQTVWKRQPWCVYAVYLTSLVNFALFYDAALFYCLSKIADQNAVYYFLAWIFVTKTVKLTSYFIREPQDLLMLPGYFIFAYFHSLIKLYAGLTFWAVDGDGRNLDVINQNNNGHDADNDDHDSEDMGPWSPSSPSFSSPSFSLSPSSSSSSSLSGDIPASSVNVRTAFTPLPVYPLAPSHESPIRGELPPAPPGWTATPWGNVRHHFQYSPVPANVLESQSMSSGSTSSSTLRTPVDVSRNSPSPPPAPITSRFHNIPALPASLYPRSPSIISSMSSSSSSSFSSSSSSSSPLSPEPASSSAFSVRYLLNRSAISSPTPSESPRPISSRSSSLSSSSSSPSTFSSSSSSSSPSPSPTSSPASPIPSLSTHNTIPIPTPIPSQPTTHNPFHPQRHSNINKPLPHPNTTSSPFTMIQERHDLGIPDEYTKTWVRGKQCHCLHSDRDNLFKTRTCRCLVPDVFKVGRNVVQGRPRF